MITLALVIWAVFGFLAVIAMICTEAIDVEKMNNKQKLFLVLVTGPLMWVLSLCMTTGVIFINVILYGIKKLETK